MKVVPEAVIDQDSILVPGSVPFSEDASFLKLYLWQVWPKRSYINRWLTELKDVDVRAKVCILMDRELLWNLFHFFMESKWNCPVFPILKSHWLNFSFALWKNCAVGYISRGKNKHHWAWNLYTLLFLKPGVCDQMSVFLCRNLSNSPQVYSSHGLFSAASTIEHLLVFAMRNMIAIFLPHLHVWIHIKDRFLWTFLLIIEFRYCKLF